MIYRRTVAVLALSIAVCAQLGCNRRVPTHPDVILIVVDTLRADHLGCFGFQGDISPGIDQLATESVRFIRTIAPAPWTAPSMASLLTSLHPQNHCVYADGAFCDLALDRENDWGVLSPEATTLAEVYRQSGYETAGFVANYMLRSKFGFSQGFETFIEPPDAERHIMDDGQILRAAEDFLERRDDDRPLFLYLHFMNVHAPYRPENEDIRAITGSPSLGEDRLLTPGEVETRPSHLDAMIRWKQPEMPHHLINWKLIYGGGVRRFDRMLGEFLERLGEQGRLKDALVLFTSDHGEEFLEHGAWEHGLTYYNPALHVPMLLRLPGARLAGTTIDSTVSLIDVMPTLLGLSGIDEALPSMQGRDLTARIEGRDTEQTWAYATGSQEAARVVTIQNDRYKLIVNPDTGSTEVYDLEADPGEMHDLSTERSDLTGELESEVSRHLDRLRQFGSLGAVQTPLSPEDVERLKSLGYLR